MHITETVLQMYIAWETNMYIWEEKKLHDHPWKHVGPFVTERILCESIIVEEDEKKGDRARAR
jgi:hypothetical protein